MITLSKGERGDLLVLGLLHQRPRHGYELKQILSGPLSLLGGNLVSTLYYTLRRLAHRGHIASDQQAGANGRFPPRTLWRLTEQGATLLPALCEEALTDLSCPCVLPIAIMASREADAESLRRALMLRRNLLAAHVLNLGGQAGEELQEDASMQSLVALTMQYCDTEAHWINSHLNGNSLQASPPELADWRLSV